MKNFFLILLFWGSFPCFAGEVDDLFSQGDREFQFERYSDEEILVRINEEAEIACDGSQCVLSSVDSNNSGWEVSFGLGDGNNNQGSGTNIYTGGVISNTNNRDYWGVTLSYHRGRCTQKINVPKSLYFSINRYMYGLMTETGGTLRGFTPADEAMIMFYTTIMKQASGCTDTNK